MRALYEDSAVPVREIASIAGVTERTIYKYVQKHGWMRRYRPVPRGEEAARANGGRRLRPAPGFAPAKGAGGRFIRRDDKGKPVALGLKATDPAAAKRAAAACRAAERLSRLAQAEAEEERRCETRIRAIENLNRALRELSGYREARNKKHRKHRKHHAKGQARRPASDGDPGRTHSRAGDLAWSAYIVAVEAALRRWQALEEQAEAG